jgi:GNAT superfamily N-acetyltransferase
MSAPPPRGPASARRLRRTCTQLVASAPGAAGEAEGEGEYTIVELQESDIPELALMMMAAYGRPPEPDGKPSQAGIDRWTRLMAITAKQWGHRWTGGDGRFVSAVAMYHDHDVAGGGPGHARVTAMVVSPEHRRHGLGQKLMHVLLDAAKGVPVSLCATKMGRPLYASERAGPPSPPRPAALGHSHRVRVRVRVRCATLLQASVSRCATSMQTSPSRQPSPRHGTRRSWRQRWPSSPAWLAVL